MLSSTRCSNPCGSGIGAAVMIFSGSTEKQKSDANEYVGNTLQIEKTGANKQRNRQRQTLNRYACGVKKSITKQPPSLQ